MNPKKRTSHRAVTTVVVLAVLSLVAAACGSSGTKTSSSSGSSSKSGYPAIPPGPIKLGMSLPLSGPLAEYGASSESAFTKVTLPFFQKEYPNGIAGHQVELDIQNDAGDPTTAVNVANEFVSQHIPVVIAPTSLPGAVDQQIAIWNKNKVPVISNYVNEGKYADGTQWPYIFASLNNDTKAGQAAASWIDSQSSIKRLAVLSDGTPPDMQWITNLTADIQAAGGSATVVKTTTITPGAVDVSTELSQLKAANPDLVLVALSQGFGPVWDALHSLDWSPQILATEDAFYDGYTSLGSLAPTALAVSSDCLSPGTQISSLPQSVQTLMKEYSPVETINNMLIFVHADNVLLELVKYAIEKYDSVDPDAIRKAMEGIHNQSFLWSQFTYSFSPTNHAGSVGHSEQVCHLSPLSDSVNRVPFAVSS